MWNLSLHNNAVLLALLGLFLATTLLPKDVTAFVVQQPQQSLAIVSTSLAATPVQVQEQDFWKRSSSSSDQQPIAERPEIVYILLYNPGTAEEGVHTSTIQEEEEQGGPEVLWASGDVGDCMQFAELLKTTEPPPEFNMALYPEPIPTPAPLSQMEMACQDMGLVLRIVPSAAADAA